MQAHASYHQKSVSGQELINTLRSSIRRSEDPSRHLQEAAPTAFAAAASTGSTMAAQQPVSPALAVQESSSSAPDPDLIADMPTLPGPLRISKGLSGAIDATDLQDPDAAIFNPLTDHLPPGHNEKPADSTPITPSTPAVTGAAYTFQLGNVTTVCLMARTILLPVDLQQKSGAYRIVSERLSSIMECTQPVHE